MKKLAIIIISLMTAFSGSMQAQAFPAIQTVPNVASSDTVQVRDRRIIRRGDHWRSSNRHHRYDRYDRRYDRRDYGRRYDRRDRNRSNAGAIIGGLAVGAIIGSAIASQNRGGSSSCAARYRSYRASDNTYQPYSGPRRVCR